MRSRSWMMCWFALLAVSAACRSPEYAPRRPMPKPSPLVASYQNPGAPAVSPAGVPVGGAVAANQGAQPTDPGKPAEGGVTPLQPGERMLVQRGRMRVEVVRTEDAMAAFLAQVKSWRGYLHSQTGTAVTVRLPAARFEDGFAWLRASGRVLEESRQAEDVTEEYVDLGIRIDNAKKARERLLEVLKKTEKVEDLMRVEVELRRLTEELETMEGRQKALAEQVAMASLEATFQSASEAPQVKRNRQPSRFGWINALGAERIMGEY